VFDIEWTPTSESNKQAAFSKKYLTTLKKISKECDKFTVACDYDIEGEVIGLNVVRFICKQKDASRMKFSTLTKDELIKAYENKSPTLDWGQAKAGETRHILDWYYGINISRALTAAIKSTGMFKIMSSGRVQAPALKIVVDREKEIKAFKPVPYWEIQLLGKLHKIKIEAWHKTGKFWEKKDADTVMKKVKGTKEGTITRVETKQFKQSPPVPFDLTSLQIESYRVFRISPKETLSIAQDLYTTGAISYPRTSSQKLPPTINYKKILNGLAKQDQYTALTESLLKGSLKPNEGKKSDPAHPAIYPTGELPKDLKERKGKVYDLIVKKFMAVFGSPATRETVIKEIEVKKEPFILKGTRTIEKGWHIYYEPYLKLEEQELPSAEKGDKVDVDKINKLDKETQPPKRYTPSSIIKALEAKGLGTKATRAQIVDTLFQRYYVEGSSSITATDIGIKTSETLEKYVPKIVDEALTRHFEEEMDEIREDKKKEDDVLAEAKVVIEKIVKEFKKNEKEVGAKLAVAQTDAWKKASNVGRCPECGSGQLQMKKGKYGMFIACSEHPECKATFSIPAGALAKVSDKVCEHCDHPMVLIIKKRRQPQEICINKECKSKKVENEHKIKEKPCPKCKEGTMVLRKSMYGSFLGCNKYPKCRTIEKLEKKEEKGNKEDKKESKSSK
jgi:DNA topoisomerase-1